MSDILEKILINKRKEVSDKKSLYPVALLEQSPFFNSPSVSLKAYLQRPDKHGIIAEIKRKSPSKGLINPNVNVEDLSIGYMQAGASALSVLTDEKFFGGKREDLMTARKFNYCPILRKDFIVDEYQLFEARSWGADVILLIAAALTPEECNQLALKANNLGLEVLLEVHDEQEIQSHLNDNVTLVGVNNRNLKTFETSLDNSINLARVLPEGIVKVAESGINTAEDIMLLKEHGFQGFLIGESFMRTSQPQEACHRLINDLEKLKNKSNAEA